MSKELVFVAVRLTLLDKIVYFYSSALPVHTVCKKIAGCNRNIVVIFKHCWGTQSNFNNDSTYLFKSELAYI